MRLLLGDGIHLVPHLVISDGQEEQRFKARQRQQSRLPIQALQIGNPWLFESLFCRVSGPVLVLQKYKLSDKFLHRFLPPEIISHFVYLRWVWVAT